jgi:mannose-6-phosphate isomerase-like protein (cupin superfamily)
MAELKYQKYILTDLKLPEEVQERAAEYNERATRVLWLEDWVIKGAPSIISSWYWKATEIEGTPSHKHDFDEVLGFFGSDPKNPHDLGGEVELWLEDEKYIIKNSCLIFIPKGLRHCPLRVVKVDRPIFFLAVSTTSEYVKKNIRRASS